MGETYRGSPGGAPARPWLWVAVIAAIVVIGLIVYFLFAGGSGGGAGDGGGIYGAVLGPG